MTFAVPDWTPMTIATRIARTVTPADGCFIYFFLTSSSRLFRRTGSLE